MEYFGSKGGRRVRFEDDKSDKSSEDHDESSSSHRTVNFHSAEDDSSLEDGRRQTRLETSSEVSAPSKAKQKSSFGRALKSFKSLKSFGSSRNLRNDEGYDLNWQDQGETALHDPKEGETGQETKEISEEERKRMQQIAEEQAKEQIGPVEGSTPVCAWTMTIVCIIFAVLLIMAGLVVLIGYLAFHPHTPRFVAREGAVISLLLDQNFTLTSYFTLYVMSRNPNSKVTVEFESVRFDMQIEKHSFARVYLPPYVQQAGNNSVPLLVSMGSVQAQLQASEGEHLSFGMQKGIVAFDLVARARITMRFGRITSVKSWLHTRCNLFFSPPPPIGNSSLLQNSISCHSWK